MSGNPQIRINLTANTPAFAAVNREIEQMGRGAKDASAYVASTGRNVDSLRAHAVRAGQAVRQVSGFWERTRNTVSRLPDLITRSSRGTDDLARNARRAKVELQDATEASRNLQQSIGIGLGVNLVDRVMQAAVSGPQMMNQLVQRGLEYNERMETGALRFEQLIGSAEGARAKMQELSDFAALTPFELPGLVEGAIALQSLTKGALSAKDGLTLVGDAAALAERPFEEISVHIARIWDGLQNNRPVGMSMMRLQELGLVTGDVRAQIEALQKAGAKGNEVWAVMEAELQKAKGQMDKLSASSAGLKANLQDIEDATLGQITVPVFEARNKGMAAQIAALEDMDLTPLIALGETWANAVSLGYQFAEIMARNSAAVAAVVRVGGAIIAGGTIVATARATHALLASYAAWVRANYAQSAYGKQATVTASQTTSQTAALNANTIAVNNNALAKQRAAAVSSAAASTEAMTAGRRTAWQLQHPGGMPVARQQGRFNGLRGAGALVGGGAVAGAAVAAAGLGVGAEWIIASYGAHMREREQAANRRAQARSAYIAENSRPESEVELLEKLEKARGDLEEARVAYMAHLDTGGFFKSWGAEWDERKADLLNNVEKARDTIRILESTDTGKIEGNAADAAAKRDADAAIALEKDYKDWIGSNAEDIEKDFEKTRLSTLNDVERMAEIRDRLRAAPDELSKTGVVDVDLSGKNARELTQEILPQLQAQLEALESGTLEHTRLQVAIGMVKEWASELKGLEGEMSNLDARAAANAATAADLRLERDIAAARLAGNDALVDELEHKRELLKVEQQIEALVKAGVMDREEAAALLKGMVEDSRKLAANEKARAQAQALRDEAGEFAVLQLRAEGHEKEAEKLERKLSLQKEIAEITKATGRDEQWAIAYLNARSALEDKIKARKDAESKDGKAGDQRGGKGRPERNWRTNQSGHREYRTADGEWKRPENMTHAERVATGTATFVRDGAAAVGMTPGFMDLAEDRYLGRTAFAPAAPSTADAAFAAINAIAPGLTPAAPSTVPASPVTPAAPPPDSTAAPVAPVAAPSPLPAAAATVSTAADNVAGEIDALAATVTAGFERLGAAVTAADQTLNQRIDAVAAQVKANRN